ncbi:hypothetical protein YC2023_048565 [Brassica napus]
MFSHVDETELYTRKYVYVHQDKSYSGVAQEWKMPRKYSSDKKNQERRYLTLKDNSACFLVVSVPEDNLSNNHEYAIMNSRRGKYFGTKFLVNVWKPEEVRSNEFSLAQTWLASGHGANINTIEAADAYKNGCYNTKCPGFVQKSSLITVGGAYNTVSQYDGVQYELSVLIWKSGENWWLRVGEELVGYWPGALFTSLGDGATRVQWGGEIVNVKTGGKHTITDMGSGHFADEGVKKASYFRNIMTVDGTNTLTEKGIFPKTTNDNCYNIKAGDVNCSSRAKLKLKLVTIPLGKTGEHIGDWEHFTLRISNFSGKLQRMYLSQHSKGSWIDAPEIEFKSGGNIPVAYASLNGHAMYAKPGLVLQGRDYVGIRKE